MNDNINITIKDSSINDTTIDKIIKSHNFEKNSLIQVLLDIQQKERWLSKENLEKVSTSLKIPLPQVYQVASFYNAFSFKPRGRNIITVCMGTACHIRGSSLLLEKLSQKLSIPEGNTTDDGRFSLLTANCMGCCALGPVISINDKYYSNSSAKELDMLIDKHK